MTFWQKFTLCFAGMMWTNIILAHILNGASLWLLALLGFFVGMIWGQILTIWVANEAL